MTEAPETAWQKGGRGCLPGHEGEQTLWVPLGLWSRHRGDLGPWTSGVNPVPRLEVVHVAITGLSWCPQLSVMPPWKLALQSAVLLATCQDICVGTKACSPLSLAPPIHSCAGRSLWPRPEPGKLPPV